MPLFNVPDEKGRQCDLSLMSHLKDPHNVKRQEKKQLVLFFCLWYGAARNETPKLPHAGRTLYHRDTAAVYKITSSFVVKAYNNKHIAANKFLYLLTYI